LEQDVFMAGVRPGSPSTQTEIKMLLCYILSKIGQTMSFEQLYEVLSENSLVNYFELVEALDRLEETGHLLREQADGGVLFSVTPVGEQAGREFQSALPLSVRERALVSAERLVARIARRREMSVLTEAAPDGGYHLHLSIPQESGALISFSLYAPNKEQCELMRRRFLNAPRFIYKGVLALLTGDRDMLDELFPPPEEQLF